MENFRTISSIKEVNFNEINVVTCTHDGLT